MKSSTILIILLILFLIFLLLAYLIYRYLKSHTNSSSHKTAPISSLAQVTNLTLIYTPGGNLQLNWTGIPGNNITYNVYTSSSSFTASPSNFLANVSTSTITLRNLPPGPHFFQVASVQNINNTYTRSAAVSSSPPSLCLPYGSTGSTGSTGTNYVLNISGKIGNHEYGGYMYATKNKCQGGTNLDGSYYNIEFTGDIHKAAILNISNRTNSQIQLVGNNSMCLFSPYTPPNSTQYRKDVSLCYGNCTDPNLTSTNSYFSFIDVDDNGTTLNDVLALNLNSQVVQGQKDSTKGDIQGPFINPYKCVTETCGSGDTKFSTWLFTSPPQ